MSVALSATMAACIDMAREAGGELVRYQGGYWAPRGSHPLANRSASHGSATVNALVSRGEAEFTEYRDGRKGSFPIAMRLVPPPVLSAGAGE